jgi:serpin B
MTMRRAILSPHTLFRNTLMSLACAAALGGGSTARAISSDSATVVAGNNQFAFDLYDHVAAGAGENVFFSPMSVSTALAMTYAGARGQTAHEMAQVLHFTLPQDELHAGYNELLADLATPERQDYELTIANRLWGQDGFPFHQSYLDVTRDQYGAELGLVDFVNDTENARQTINHWVEEETHDRIKDLLPAGTVTPDTRLVLTNAIYFLGDWQSQFSPSQTHDDVFHVSATELRDVSMMQQENNFRYADLPHAQVLEMPYKGDDVSMLLVLPHEDDGLTAVDEWLSPATLAEAVDSLDRQRVSVSLPKFTIESDVRLTGVLQEMGMQSPFSWSADFSGMADANLAISDVVHKAFLRVDEKGTEAAAATGVVVGVTSVPPPPDAYFRADHPFFLALRDNRTESLLFLGRVMRPDAADDDSRELDLFAGDFNGDGQVDQGDLDLVLLNWGADAGQPIRLDGWRIGTPEGIVDQGELDAVLLHWGRITQTDLQTSSIPEPATWLLVAGCLVAMRGLAAGRCSAQINRRKPPATGSIVEASRRV